MHKILIVEDDESTRKDIHELFSNAGFEVVGAIDGMDGLTKAHENTDIDVVLTDYQMPNKDGLSMCLDMRKLPHLQDTPIFILSSHVDQKLSGLGHNAKIMAWITKPYIPDSLVKGIVQVLNARQLSYKGGRK
ncbi:MAG: response regulator [Oligoflexales bacterium]|nr:response regulator [Oligoflexales bacterium]